MAVSFRIAALPGQSGRLAELAALLALAQQCQLQAGAGELGGGPSGGNFLVGFGLLIQTSAWLDVFGAAG